MMSPIPRCCMHFTPLGQMEMAAPTGFISFTASNTVQSIPAFFSATAALRPPMPAPITIALMLLSFCRVYKGKSNLRTRLQSGEKRVVWGGFALLRCANAVRMPFYESIISCCAIRNRLFHGGWQEWRSLCKARKRRYDGSEYDCTANF